jgi:hypothetical protein
MGNVFVYHAKWPDFVGDRLYPLNALKERLPDVYTRAIKKYEGREWLLTAVIPVLNVLWNDMIHFSLMHPSLIYKTMSDLGFDHHKKPREWFEVPLEDVMRLPSVLYINSRDDRSKQVFPGHDFEPVSEARVKALSGMPERNLAYYKECYAGKTWPLLWGYAPHVLVNSDMRVSDYRTVDWSS